MDEHRKSATEDFAETTQKFSPLLTWSWQFALTLGVFAYGGHWLDQHYGTKVVFILIGMFVGLFGGFYNLYRVVKILPKPAGRSVRKNEHEVKS